MLFLFHENKEGDAKEKVGKRYLSIDLNCVRFSFLKDLFLRIKRAE